MTLEFSRAERATSNLIFRKIDESHAVEASSWNDLFAGGSHLQVMSLISFPDHTILSVAERKSSHSTDSSEFFVAEPLS